MRIDFRTTSVVVHSIAHEVALPRARKPPSLTAPGDKAQNDVAGSRNGSNWRCRLAAAS